MMAARRKTTRKGTRSTTGARAGRARSRRRRTKPLGPTQARLMRAAVREGRNRAEEIMQRRSRKMARARERTVAGENGIVIAEGDSWFDYPFMDVLELLEDVH